MCEFRLTNTVTRWFDERLMRTTTTTAFVTATANAVSFTDAVAASYAFAMWSKPAVKHQNKRHTRRAHGVLI